MFSESASHGMGGKVAIITGASRGIGRAAALELARRDCTTVLVQRGPADDVVREIRDFGGSASVVQADLADADQVDAVIPAVLERHGGADILVANAGIIDRRPAVDITAAGWDSAFAVNVTAGFRLAQALGRHLLDAGKHGKIVNVASILGLQGGYRVAAYAASKGAVVQLTRALSNEWAPSGINVNAVAPGYVDNEITAPIRNDAARYDEITRRIPAGRWGTNEEIALAIAFLAGPDSDYVHGHVLAVDGGWLAR